MSDQHINNTFIFSLSLPTTFHLAIRLPLVLDFYSIMSIDDQAKIPAQNLCNALRGDCNFRRSPKFSASALPNSVTLSPTSTVSVATKKLDWTAQQTALDELFDVALKKQYENLPNITVPDCLQNISLMEHQIKGIKWLVTRETHASLPPFYTNAQEKLKGDEKRKALLGDLRGLIDINEA